MPWICPACGEHVRHYHNHESLPRPGRVYRCPVCRLELIFDAKLGKMRPAPGDYSRSNGADSEDRDRRPRRHNGDRANLPARYARGAMLGRSREVASSQLTEEPGLRRLPVSHNGLRRDVQDLRRFLDGQAPKEPQLDDLTHPRIE